MAKLLGMLVVFIVAIVAIKLAVGFVAMAAKAVAIGCVVLGVLAVGKLVLSRRK